MTRLYPHEESREPLAFTPNPNGSRVFRVTDRSIDQRTRLIIADSPEAAVADNVHTLSELAHETIHEVVECVEYVAQGMTWQSPPERQT